MSTLATRRVVASLPDASALVSWPWRIGAVLALLAAGALLAFTLAFWGWRWLGPAPPVPAPDKASDPPWTPMIVAASLFGRSASTAPQATGVAAAPAATGLPADARLLGIFAGRDGEGYALFRMSDRGALLVARGQDVVADVRLDAVLPDRIRISEHGTARDLPLRREDGIAPAPPVPAPAAAPARSVAVAKPTAVRPQCARPAGFSGPVYRLNAELLAGMVAKPDTWSGLLAPESGALVVRDETGLAAMLGMKSGDRVSQSNGIALASIDDMLTAVVRPLIASQPVHLHGTRDGRPREWLFLNAGACPT